MKKIIDFISDLTRRASSRKFIVLLLAVGLHLRNSTPPSGFTSDHLVWVFAIFMGVNVVQKFFQK